MSKLLSALFALGLTYMAMGILQGLGYLLLILGAACIAGLWALDSGVSKLKELRLALQTAPL